LKYREIPADNLIPAVKETPEALFKKHLLNPSGRY
jgi:hypothetical protein